MDASPVCHPDDGTLRAYGLGTLDDGAAEAVTRHLDNCSDCVHRVAGLSSDSFLSRLRQAYSTAGDVPRRAEPIAAAPTDPASTAPFPKSTKELPAELANHPDYKILREMVGGAMGRVYLAHNRLMGRNEVLKLIGPEVVNRPGVRDRFLREIRAVASLRHPNIVTAYSAFRAGEDLVFAMEYVEGLDLARLVKAKGPMPIGHACYFIHQAALGLQHAHEKGLVHRDIKPGNLMLTQKGGKSLIKVLDFGLAKAGREQLTQPATGRPRGPQGDRGGTADPRRSDVGYARLHRARADRRRPARRHPRRHLQPRLHALFPARRPATFPGDDPPRHPRAHRSTQARPLNLARPEVPAELAAIVARMTAKEPDRRFQTPKEVAETLTPFFRKPPAGTSATVFGGGPTALANSGRSVFDLTQPGTDMASAVAPTSQADDGRGCGRA